MDPNSSSVLTVSTTTATPAHDTFVPIRGEASSDFTVATNTNAQIKMQNFTASALPTTLQTITSGNSKDFTANFAAINGFSQPSR